MYSRNDTHAKEYQRDITQGDKNNSPHNLCQKGSLDAIIDLARRKGIAEERLLEPSTGLPLTKDHLLKGLDQGVEFAARGIAADVDHERLGEQRAEMEHDVVDGRLDCLRLILDDEEGGLQRRFSFEVSWNGLRRRKRKRGGEHN